MTDEQNEGASGKRRRRKPTGTRRSKKRTARRKTGAPKRMGRLFMILVLIGLTTCAGTFLFFPHTWQGIGMLLPDAEPQKPANRLHDMREPEAAERIARILFVRRAVEARIDSADYVPISRISPDLQRAVVAVEDRRFYEHTGFDMTGMMRATLVNMQHGRIEEGASTITQQLVKNLFLENDRSFTRKAEEILLALDIEIAYTKPEILEMYLNVVYYGAGYYGVGAASEGYYGKEPAVLDLPEASMLAGIPNAPSELSPFVDFIAAKKRQAVVLDAMEAQNYIDRRTAEDAKIQPLILRPKQNF